MLLPVPPVAAVTERAAPLCHVTFLKSWSVNALGTSSAVVSCLSTHATRNADCEPPHAGNVLISAPGPVVLGPPLTVQLLAGAGGAYADVGASPATAKTVTPATANIDMLRPLRRI